MALQERIEQHASGCMGTPIDADADFASFIVESENLRDAVKLAKPGSTTAVGSEMRQSTSLQLIHDLAIKVKHGKQSREQPWSTAKDATYVVKVSKGLHDSSSPVPRRAGSTTLPGTTASPPPEPTRWAHRWEIQYTPLSTTLTVDGVQFSREVTADWQQVLAAFGLL